MHNKGKNPSKKFKGNPKKKSIYKTNSAPLPSSFQPTSATTETTPKEGVRLNKYLANSGVGSRREADTFIASGMVSINGKVVTEMGVRVLKGDKVLFNGEELNPENHVYVLLNKPKNFITISNDPQGRKTVYDLIKNACEERVYPVGRLDRMTTGLLLFTNDSELAKKLAQPEQKLRKIYHVLLDKPVTKRDIVQLLKGVKLEDGIAKADKVEYVKTDDTHHEIGIELHSGKNRVIRRMLEALAFNVVKLDRVYYAGLTKKNLPRGKYRVLNAKEIAMLKMLG